MATHKHKQQEIQMSQVQVRSLEDLIFLNQIQK